MLLAMRHIYEHKVIWGCNHAEVVVICSVQGYGPKGAGLGGHIYPGSGATCDTKHMTANQVPPVPDPSISMIAPGTPTLPGKDPLEPEDVIPDDPGREFKTMEGSHPSASGPRVINAGIPGPGPLL